MREEKRRESERVREREREGERERERESLRCIGTKNVTVICLIQLPPTPSF